ncbi:MAG TPA: glycosyltransferase family 4 protein, partial [Candidatus Omnitrophota bacterium]|nr:glycosyltransferase family 4 protein [Candidatus Omnitrophota bacterium]
AVFSMHHPHNGRCEHERYFVSHVDFDNMNPGRRISASLRVMYSFEAKRKIMDLVRDERPDVAHLHNIYHQISPSILHALKKRGVPAVMTLHDFKIVCPGHTLSLNNRICDRCKDGRFYNCYLNGCVKRSRMKSLLGTVEMYVHHRLMKIYDLIDVFIVPSIFMMDKLKEMGFKGKTVHIPNFVNIEAFEPQYGGLEDSVAYYGRIARGKGLGTLIDAMSMLPDVSLKIYGEGEEKGALADKVKAMRLNNVEFKGYVNGGALRDEIRKSRFVVMPAENIENNPRSIIEAFALGKPVIGTRSGGIPELVKDGHTGLLFDTGDTIDLAGKISALMGDRGLITALGRNARRLAEGQYSDRAHYQKLMDVYQGVTKRNGTE